MLAINLINHILKQNPEVCRELSGFNGLVIGIQTAGFYLIGRINAEGLLDASTRRPHTVLILDHHAIPQLLQGKHPDFNDLALEGDVELGMNLVWRFCALRYSPQQDLRHVLGNDLSDKTTKFGQILRQIGQFLMLQHSPNAQEALIEQLQADLAQTQQRLAQLEARLNEPRRHTRR